MAEIWSCFNGINLPLQWNLMTKNTALLLQLCDLDKLFNFSLMLLGGLIHIVK